MITYASQLIGAAILVTPSQLAVTRMASEIPAHTHCVQLTYYVDVGDKTHSCMSTLPQAYARRLHSLQGDTAGVYLQTVLSVE